MGIFSQQLISIVALFPRIFLYILGTVIFRNISGRSLFILFSLTAVCRNKNLPFCFFVSSKNKTSCTYKLAFGICLIIPDVFLKFSPALKNTKAAFERCFTKVVVQQNDAIKYSSSVNVNVSAKSISIQNQL